MFLLKNFDKIKQKFFQSAKGYVVAKKGYT